MMYCYPLPLEQDSYKGSFVKGEVEVYLPKTGIQGFPVTIAAFVHGHYAIHLRLIWYPVQKVYEQSNVWDLSYKGLRITPDILELAKEDLIPFAKLCVKIYPEITEDSYFKKFFANYWNLEQLYPGWDSTFTKYEVV